jgi:hypothetical protein
MSWPYSPDQCPRCRYFEELVPPAHDDAGYELPGVCRHPRIGMELFVPMERAPRQFGSCPLFHPAPRDGRA